MTRKELIDWAVAHATGSMVSPVAVAVLRELLGDDWACRLLDATEKMEPKRRLERLLEKYDSATGIVSDTQGEKK